jgi:hypothetical protein
MDLLRVADLLRIPVEVGPVIPFEVGQHSVAMWGRIPLGSGALLKA